MVIAAAVAPLPTITPNGNSQKNEIPPSLLENKNESKKQGSLPHFISIELSDL